MKQILNLYKSWRNDIIFVLVAVGTLLLVSWSDNLVHLIVTKIMAFGCFFLTARLMKWWSGKKLLNDLMNYIGEE